MTQFAMIAKRVKPVLVTVVSATATLWAFASIAEAGDQWRHGQHSGSSHSSSHHSGFENSGSHSSGRANFANREFRGSTLSGRHHREMTDTRRFDRQGDGHRNRPGETDRSARSGRRGDFNGGSSSFVRGFDTYAGSIEAYSIPGHGAYFVRDDDWSPTERRSAALAPKAKIIDVDQEMGGNAFASEYACSFEAGVCVIRGRN